jgi:plastocyanin
MEKRFVIAGIALAAGLIFAALGTLSFSATAQQDQAGSESPAYLYKLNQKYDGDYDDGVLTVRVGAGGAVAPLTWFFPKNANIKVGETVEWYNPTSVAEPHTVTFTFGDEVPAIDAPFIVSNTTEFAPLVPGSNVEPFSIPGENGTNIVVAANARSWNPTVIDADGNVTYLPPNGNYTITGTEQYVSSGFLWPQGQAPPGLPPIEKFSVTFANEGTYDYICILHPWMAGQVNVTE